MTKKLPKISIITPALNQYKFIERTIKSVLSQNYPNLEYIIIDGGSTDGTIDILKKYQKKLQWYSQKDKGQTDALNRGLRLSTGQFITYLNSDDIYLPDALSKVAQHFIKHPESVWLTGKCRIINETGNYIRSLTTIWKNFWLKNLQSHKNRLFFLSILNYISQPATFWSREAFNKIGKFDENLRYTMDYDYWFRLMGLSNFYFMDDYLAAFRIHKESKGVKYTNEQFSEGYQVATRYNTKIISKSLRQLHNFITVVLYRLLENI